MNFQQVALAVMAFSSARGGTVVRGPYPETQRQIAVIPPFGLARIIVEQQEHDQSWQVRLSKLGRRSLQPPVYFPSTHSPEGLKDALARAWEFHQTASPPAPFLTRFLEPPNSAPPPASSSPSRSASPPRRRRDA